MSVLRKVSYPTTSIVSCAYHYLFVKSAFNGIF